MTASIQRQHCMYCGKDPQVAAAATGPRLLSSPTLSKPLLQLLGLETTRTWLTPPTLAPSHFPPVRHAFCQGFRALELLCCHPALRLCAILRCKATLDSGLAHTASSPVPTGHCLTIKPLGWSLVPRNYLSWLLVL